MDQGNVFGDDITNDLVRILVLYKELGKLMASLEWKKCFDPDGKTSDMQELIGNLVHAKQKIARFERDFSVYLSDEELAHLKEECLSVSRDHQEIIERQIEVEHRPGDLNFNAKAVINLTDLQIPEDTLINLSFGYKFLSPYSCNDKNMHVVLAQLEECLHKSVSDMKQLEASIDMHLILKDRDSVQYDDTKRWLSFISHRAIRFFKSNPNVFATKSDKGGHTVIISVAEYDNKLGALINEGEYSDIPLEDDPLHYLVEMEIILIDELKNCEKSKNFLNKHPARKAFSAYFPDTLVLPKFYGLPKIHKPGVPLRPITSTRGSPGYCIAKQFDALINQVFPRTGWHIRDSYEFVDFIGATKIKDDDRLVSFDVVSMFPSIPYDLVYDIILSEADKFLELFDIGVELLQSLVKFCFKDCMFFTTPDGLIHRQNDGLPMGSCLSPTIARLVMDRAVANLFVALPNTTFVKVFVDDTIVAIGAEHIEDALNHLNAFCPGKIVFTCEKEDEHAHINFLNTSLFRKGESIQTNWYRKGFASGRLLNYYSSHKRPTVIATAVHFIQTVLQLSDGEFFMTNKPIVERTLRDNSFPETTILSLMNEYYTYMKPFRREKEQEVITQEASVVNGSQLEDEEPRYVVFPQAICRGRALKRVLYQFKKKGVILTDSTRNSRINAITTRKNKTPIAKRGNTVVTSRCECKKKCVITETGYGETGEITLSSIVNPNNKTCRQRLHAYTSAQYHRGLYYGGQTRYLASYMQWKKRDMLDSRKCRYHPPNDRLRRLLR